jgi:hypothetical protein
MGFNNSTSSEKDTFTKLRGPENFTTWERELKQSATAARVWNIICGEEAALPKPKRSSKPSVHTQ